VRRVAPARAGRRDARTPRTDRRQWRPLRPLITWRERNRHTLWEFWARAPADALGVKQEFETALQDVSAFSGPRQFAAFLGLTPKQNSSGGKERLGRVSKMGNRHLRKLLVVGAHAVLYHRKPHEDALRSWAKKLMQSKPFKLQALQACRRRARQ
jgi:hypothetical protein